MEFITLTAETANANAAITLNGFPLCNVNGAISMPIDLYCLAENKLQVTITPEQNAHIILTISRESEGNIVSTDNTTPGLVNINESVPTAKTYEFTFKTPDKTYGQRLQGAPLPEQEALTYAKTLATLLQNKADVTPEFLPKFEDYSSLYQVPLAQMTSEFLDFLKKFTLNYDPAKITVKQATPTVCELLYDGKSFISNADGFNIDVFAAKVNGTIKVVR